MRIALLALLFSVAGCTSLPEPESITILDEATGVSIRRVASPIVLARDRREVAANARDYLTLVAVESNQAGRRQLALLVYRWSTIDKRMDAAVDAAARDLLLVSDGRDVLLRPFPGELPTELRPRAALLQPDVAEVSATAYGVDAATLRLLVEGRELAAAFRGVSGARSYRIWRDGRLALRRFIDG